MKKTLCLILSLLFCISCFSACASGNDNGAGQSTTTKPSTTQPEQKTPLSVLFIGNSYTYYNDMPHTIFAAIAEAAGYEPNIISVTGGGWSLYQHANPMDQCGNKVMLKHLVSKNVYMFDYVVLQEQSMRPASNDLATFYDATRTLVERAKAIYAQPIMYCTWGRRSDSDYLIQAGLTNETMTWKLAASYTAIAEELDIPVGYVGLAFYEVYTGNSGIELYDPDTSHPSYAGSYLAAMTLFAQMTGVDPTTINYNGDLSAEDAAVLKLAAKNAVFNTPQIPAEYIVSSEGVTNNTEE